MCYEVATLATLQGVTVNAAAGYWHHQATGVISGSVAKSEARIDCRDWELRRAVRSRRGGVETDFNDPMRECAV